MSKKLDADIKALQDAARALDGSSSLKMLRANLNFLWDRYIDHPHPETLQHFLEKTPEKLSGRPV